MVKLATANTAAKCTVLIVAKFSEHELAGYQQIKEPEYARLNGSACPGNR